MNLNLLRNILYNWAGMLGSMLYAFFMVPYIIKSLGDSNYGLWNLIASVVGYVAILDFGLQSSVNRYVAKYKALTDTCSVNAVYSNGMAVYSIIALAAASVGIFVAIFFDAIFNVPREAVGMVSTLALVMVIYSALELPLSLYGSILYAYQRFDLLNVVTVGALAVQSTLLLVLFRWNMTLQTFCYIIIGVGCAKYGVNFMLSHRVVGDLKFRRGMISRQLLGEMAKFSGTTFAAIIANNIIFKTDNIVIGMFLNTKAITIYSIGFMLTEYASQIIGRMCNTLTPQFNEHHSRNETQELNALILSSSRFSTLIGIPMGLAALVIGNDFITLWLGPGYHGAYAVMAILMCARMCGFPTAPLYSMLYGVGKHHLILFPGIGEAVLNLGLSIFLVRRIGLTGVAWGTFIPMFLGNIVFVILVFSTLKLSIMEWLTKALLGPALFSVFFVASIYSLCTFFTAVSWPVLFLKSGCIVAVYGVLFFTVGLTGAERGKVVNALFSRFASSGEV